MSQDQTCAPSRVVDAIDQSVRAGRDAGVLMLRASRGDYSGRTVDVEDRALLNFGGCSYLGLEKRAELVEATIDAVRRYGTQFSFSRAYIESPLYGELEETLERVTGGHVLVTATTSLGHIAALPTLIGARDMVLVDKSAHASLHTALSMLHGPSMSVLPHNNMTVLRESIAAAVGQHERVWYVLDGLYSMLGDFAPFDQIADMLAEFPSLHLYVDDAHATSWTGTFGRGKALEVLADRSRVVVALSLNKAFSAAGGALVFPSAELRDRVRRCGGPMLFSGPIQPPMLGAALASARLHLEPGFAALQSALAERIESVVQISRELGLTLVSEERSPIFFVTCGALASTFNLLRTLRERGIYMCAGMFPAVPRERSGPRFTVSTHNALSDIRAMLEALSEELVRHRTTQSRDASRADADCSEYAVEAAE